MTFLVYDGDCPFCSKYVEFRRLKEIYPNLELVDARENPDHPAIAAVRAQGLLIDDGMALVDGKEVIHGADVMKRFSKGTAYYTLFKSSGRANIAYSLLRQGRSLVLKMLRRDKLGY